MQDPSILSGEDTHRFVELMTTTDSEPQKNIR